MDMERLAAGIDARMNRLKCHAVLTSIPALHVVDEARKTGIVWLRWTQFPAPGEAPADDFLLAFEALELLTLLAHVAYDQWLGLLKATWPHATTRWVNALYPSKFKLGVAVLVTQGGELTRWAERAFARKPTLANDDGVDFAYDVVREELEALLDRDDKETQIHVRFVLGDTEHAAEAVDNYSLLLSEVVHIARTQAARTPSSWYQPRWDSLFRLVEARGDAFSSDLTIEEVLCVEEIVSCGVRVPYIIASALALREAPRAIQGFTLLRRTILSTAKHGFGVVAGVILDHQVDHQTLDGIFSAVLHSSTVREMVVGFFPDDDYRLGGHSRLMGWLARCVFRGYGCPSLDTLTMSGLNLQMSDVQALERALQCDALSKDRRVCDNADADKVVSASKCALVRLPEQQDGPVGLRKIVFNAPLQNLQVFEVHGEWISVLLPGWGKAYVRASDVCLEQKPAAFVASRQRSQPLRRLNLYLVPGNLLVILLKLLRVVGHSVKVISVTWDDDPPMTKNWIRSLCLACPFLEVIEVEVLGLSSLDMLASCYEEGICRAQRLIVRVDGIALEGSTESKFFRCLAEKNHLMTRYLREVVIYVRKVQFSSRLSQLVTTGLDMLVQNHVLWNLDVTIELVGEDGENTTSEWLASLEANFSLYDDEPVAVRVAPLRVKNKVAFLSAVRGSPERSARSRMDPSVIGQIFEYAAECKKRHVQLSVV